MDEELLILEVQNHEILYDPSHAFYKDNHKNDRSGKKLPKLLVWMVSKLYVYMKKK